MRRFARKLGVNYRVGMGTKATKAIFTTSETLPMTIVIDRKGVVHDVIEGLMYSDEFDQKVKPLLVTHPKSSAADQRRKPSQSTAKTITIPSPLPH